VDLTEDALQALQDWRPRSSDEHVFPFRTTAAGRCRLRELCKLAGVQCLGLHSLRHAAGSSLLQETGGLDVPLKRLGHADTSTTQIYAAMDDRSLKAALARRGRRLPTTVAT